MLAKSETLKDKPAPSFKIPWFIRIPGQILQQISTAWATQFALRLFFSPLKFPIPEREKPFRYKATVHELMTGGAKDFKVFELPAKGPKVVMIHGWSGRGSQFFKMMDFLHQRDFHVFAVEAPAHGDFLGPRTHMLDFVDALEECDKRFGPFYGAIGHSLGGMALFNNLNRRAQYQKLAIIGSPANISGVVYDFCEKVGFSDKVHAGILQYIKDRYQLDPADASSDVLCQRHRVEGLIAHDEDDYDVSFDSAERMHEKWRGSKLIRTRGLGHRKILLDDGVLSEVYDFLRN